MNKAVRLALRLNSGRTLSVNARVGDSLLQVAQKNDLNIDGTCDGDLNCSTCHCVLPEEDFKRSPAMEFDKEADLLEQAFGVERTSRLSCQVKVTPEMEGSTIKFPSIHEKAKAWRQNIGVVTQPELKIEPKKYQSITKRGISKVVKRYLSEPYPVNPVNMFALASVLPFRTNNYICEEVIDWSNIPNDPIYQLTFPQEGMLHPEDLEHMKKCISDDSYSPMALVQEANKIRQKMNPHPAMQKEMNVPMDDDGFVDGMQHKYGETVLFFPSESQYCHAYCTYCFRWAQFVGSEDMQFASNDSERLFKYLKETTSVTDLLMTGGDPMVQKAHQLQRYLEPLLAPEFDHIQTVRIGTKSLAYWPYRYVTDDDADDTLRLFERLVKGGKHVSFMAHWTHPQEIQTPVVREAIRRLRNAGVQIRCQSPTVAHVNDDSDTLAELWDTQVSLGMIPYYMFVERDTGPKGYFELSLDRAVQLYQGAISQVSGLGRTVRGPSMSATPGKVHVIGVSEVKGEKVFVLQFLQARDTAWLGKPFFAKFDEKATWLGDLQPAFGEKEFFFEQGLRDLQTEMAERAKFQSLKKAKQLHQQAAALKNEKQEPLSAEVSKKLAAVPRVERVGQQQKSFMRAHSTSTKSTKSVP